MQTFSVPIEKEITKIDKDGNESAAIISKKENLLIVKDTW